MMRKTLCPCPRCRAGKCGICNEMNPKVLSHTLIRSEKDIFDLNIVDWGRLNGYWRSPADAVHTIASWFINTSHATLVEMDIRNAPTRDDFPGWDHVGGHEDVGRLLWNWFHHHCKGSLTFSDSPDFYGTINLGGKEHNFYGDVGEVSPVALAMTQKQMQAGDLWITIRNEKRQVLIEPFVSLFDIWGDMILPDKEPVAPSTPPLSIVQATLW